MNLVRLKVPAQDRTDGEFVSRSLIQAASWLDELPRGDAVSMATAVRDALLAINRGPLRKIPRLQLMELLRPVVNDACAMLIALYRNSSYPLSELDNRRAELVRQLQSELALGFKICVNEQLDAWNGDINSQIRPTLQLAIQRAILALGRTLLECYRVYATEPAMLWHDLHTLYRNSERSRLQALPIEGSRDSDETALSIKQAYLRVAVLAMANPYHLMQGEAEELYRRIGRWVHFVQIIPVDRHADLSGKFILDLASDLPARYLPADLKLPPAGDPRVLDLGQMVAAISAQLGQPNQILPQNGHNTLSNRLQRDMYRRLLEALGGRSARASERKATIARLTLVDGLSACHFFLSGRQAFTPEQDQAQWEQRLGIKAKPEFELRLLDDNEPAPASGIHARQSRASRFKGHDAEADDVWRKATLISNQEPSERRLRRSRFQAATWHRKNESSGGIALFCARDCPSQVKVGELVAYADEDSSDPASWRVGAIRWLRTRPNRGLELGIKHLADSGYAVGTQAINGAGKGSEYLRSIVVPRANPLLHPTTLITPAGVYDVGTIVRLNMKEVMLHAKLTELIETTRLFAHFRFKIVEAPLQGRR